MEASMQEENVAGQRITVGGDEGEHNEQSKNDAPSRERKRSRVHLNLPIHELHRRLWWVYKIALQAAERDKATITASEEQGS